MSLGHFFEKNNHKESLRPW